ncbi:MAG: methylenetetrahydrofolate--tRNA-(uracil(54)-C(5))-methyltransferase (FADH(2)-oxidizing) TrmFO [Selenomonadaceae bacterium]|nr:methylenetetrahydrofolate--tRNA-(uracil(54)-C(5))-methyltransferase (FADH(2)-oxidizing) TrmFO [Selenomonadaceae bacterium]
MTRIEIIGAGLAGAEAAYQASKSGAEVVLYEMRPAKLTPAHKTGEFAELVCSNSLRAAGLENAVGVLKEEMRLLDSLIISTADENQIPAGGALAVDRSKFSRAITEKIRSIPNIEIVAAEIKKIPTNDQILIIASGPLTSDSLAESIREFTGEEYFYFYDSAAPIVTRESIDFTKVFEASRYDKGEPAYLNCPMDESTYKKFYAELMAAEKIPVHEFDREIFFDGCLPIEEMARRGEDVLRFAPMKPVGLKDPATGEIPYAVVQLRREDQNGNLYNLVGFQTRLKWNEQTRIFRMIPGLEHAEFARLGVMHRNSFLNAPKILRRTFQTRIDPTKFFAGQITGVEGYVESAASGLIAGINASRIFRGLDPLEFPIDTCIGSLGNYLETAESKNFQPMNVNFGLLPPLENRVKKKDKKRILGERALNSIRRFIDERISCDDNRCSS